MSSKRSTNGSVYRAVRYAQSHAVFCLLLVPLFAGVVTAQEPMDMGKYLQHLTNTSNKTIANLLDAFRPHVPQAKRHLLTTSKISVHALSGFYAYSNLETNEIVIPVGLVLEVHLQALAYVYVQRSPASAKYLDEWSLYLANRANKVAERYRNRISPVDDLEIEHFWQHSKLPDLGSLSDEEGVAVATIMYATLGLVLGHELGHLVLDHQPYGKISRAASREQEAAADDFALKLLTDTGANAIPGLSFGFMRFVINEHEFRSFDPISSTHPEAKCRVYRLLKSELNRFFKSETEQNAFFEKSGLSPTKASEILAAIKTECGM